MRNKLLLVLALASLSAVAGPVEFGMAEVERAIAARGFDFGAPARVPRGAPYRNDPYVLGNTVAPRFRAVNADTQFSEATGHGWASGGDRETHALPLAPYHEVRAVAREPRNLPANVLFGDWIEGRGPQTFRLRAPDGPYTVLLLHPDGSAVPQELHSVDGHLDVVFPEREWRVAGLVVRSARAPEPLPPRKTLKRPPRPPMTHVPPKTAPEGQPLNLLLKIVPAGAAQTVRLHYRPLNQLMDFKMLESPGDKPAFVIPGEDVSGRWDLMYYFEVLNHERTGWFEPDPHVATPYYVAPR